MKRILFFVAVLFVYPTFRFARNNMRSVPKSALLEGEVRGSHATPTISQSFQIIEFYLGIKTTD